MVWSGGFSPNPLELDVFCVIDLVGVVVWYVDYGACRHCLMRLHGASHGRPCLVTMADTHCAMHMELSRNPMIKILII